MAQNNCTASGCFGTNQIIFGDFENFSQSNPFSNFTSEYNFNGPCISGGNGCGNYLCQQSFAVNNNLTPCNPTWSTLVHDHTSGSGNMMIVDFPNNGPEKKIWCTQINLQANKDYCFGAWFINLLTIGSNQGQPAFSFRLNGNVLFNSPSIPEDEQWHFYGTQFNSGAGGNVELCIYNANWGFLGYDVAIDDISLREIINGQEPLLQNDTVYICQGSSSVTIPVLQNDWQGTNPALVNNTLTISVPPAFSQGQITNINTTNGSITFTPNVNFSGTASFQYSVCNSAGCCSQATVLILSSPTPIITANASPNTICAGSSSNLSANGANTYQWSPAASLSAGTGASVTATPTATTTYTVTGTNNNGCSASVSLTVTVQPLPNLQLSVYDTSICFGQAVAVQVAGAQSVLWSPDFNQMPVPYSYILVPAVTTTYTVTGVTNNCTATNNLIVHVIPLPNLNVTPAAGATICEGESLFVITSGANNYSWQPGSAVNQTNDTALLTPLASTTYTLTGNDNYNCTATLLYPVQVIPKPDAAFNCPENLCIGAINIINTSNNATTFQWLLNGQYIDSNTNLNYSFTDTGTYLLQLIAAASPNCSDTADCVIQVFPNPSIQSVYSSGIENSFSANISIQSSGGDYCFIIINTDTILLSHCSDTTLIYDFPGPGVQSVQLLVTNLYGCTASYLTTLTIKDNDFIFVPNAFSPNQDGLNDVFIPYFTKPPSYYVMSIYNRWGQKVFESNSTKHGWDGNYANGPAALGVYVYVIQYALPGYAEPKILKGNISLLK